MANVWRALDEAKVNDEQRAVIEKAISEDREERWQEERISKMEEKICGMQKSVEMLMKKVLDLDTDDADAIISTVASKGVF